MSEYEGKVSYRSNSHNVDLIDVLYYEATGEMMTSKEKEKVIKMLEEKE